MDALRAQRRRMNERIIVAMIVDGSITIPHVRHARTIIQEIDREMGRG